MIVAIAQSAVTPDVRQNGTRIRECMDHAAASQARVLHLPEAALSGYVKSEIRSWESVDWRIVEDERAAIATHAARLGLWIVVGCNHRLTPPLWPQNSVIVISDRGKIVARYSKRFLSHTEVTSWYTPGAEAVTFTVDGFRFGCALCIEVCFPEIFAEYERLDVDCVLLSSYSRDATHALLARAHAATNCYWLSLATPAQSSDGLPSMLVGPDGAIIVAGATGTTDLLLGTIDRATPKYDIALRRARPWRRRARSAQSAASISASVASARIQTEVS